MRITERHKRWWLLLLYLLLPLMVVAQDSAVVEKRYLWDSGLPANVDSVDEWWTRGRLVERQVPAAVMEKLKADKKLQYDRQASDPRNSWIVKLLEGMAGFLFRIRVLILVLLALGVLTLLLFFMRQQGFRLFRKKGTNGTPWITTNEPDFDMYGQQAREAIAAGRFRQAVRYLYLQTLWLLSNKQLITLSKDKTNADYLRALLSTRWHRSFARLTLDYEYVWYGEMAVNPEQFEHIHGEFRRFISELSNGER